MDFPQVSQIFKFSKNKNHYVSPHKHENTEYVFYINGNGRTIIGNTEYTFSKGSVAVINPNTVHDERHFTEGELIYFITSGISSEISNGVYTPQNFIELKKIITNMYLESRSPKFGHTRIMSSYAEQVRLLLIRDLISQKDDSSALDKIMNRLKNECNSDIDIKNLVSEYGMGYDNFRIRFKKTYDMSPNKFIIYNRLLCACDLLTMTNKSCTEIAFECNFTDSAQFSKMFKAQYGISPNEYRRNYNN